MERPTEKFYTITELAEHYGITPRTIRFYEAKGLLMPQRVGWTRAYTHRDYARMELILRAKRLGFTLADVKEYLSLYDADTTQVEQLKLLARRVRMRISDLERQRTDLGKTLKELREIEEQAAAALAEKGVAFDGGKDRGNGRPAPVTKERRKRA
jgi:DNA-binding transcriptional MerR regulator